MNISGKIQTVLGVIEPSDLGVTLTHEHLSLKYNDCFREPPAAESANADLPLTLENMGWIRQYPYSCRANLDITKHEEAVLSDAKKYKKFGGCSIVENTTVGIYRDIHFVRKVSETTGLNIVAGTGYYFEGAHTPAGVEKLSVEQMVAQMTADLTQGVDGTDMKCGVIGEVGCSYPLTAFEKRSLEATAMVQSSLGCPVIIHPGRFHSSPFEVVRILQEAGGDASRTVMSHLDRTLGTDEERLEFAKLGCINEYDLFGIEVSHYQPVPTFDMPSDAERIRCIKDLIREGYEDNIVIAQDIHTNHRLTKFGGHGYHHILTNVVPMMLCRGISQEQVDKILIHTPARWLTIK